MAKVEFAIVSFLRASIEESVSCCKFHRPLSKEEWKRLIRMISAHGVTALVFSQIERLPKELLPPINLLMDVLGQVECKKMRYTAQVCTAQKFAKALKDIGIDMMVLKGVAFSTYYDVPSHREFGDCDCYLVFSENLNYPKGLSAFEVGNEVARQLGAKVDYEHYKHSHILFDGLMIENHEFLTDFDGTYQGKKTERLLRKAIVEDKGSLIEDTSMLCPNSHFNALFLIRHAYGDFMDGGIMLRVFYDWAMLLRREQENLNWNKLNADLEKCRLRRFADVMTAICVKFFGLTLTADGITMCSDKKLVEEVMMDTLRGDCHFKLNETFGEKCLRIIKRFKRVWHYRRLAAESVSMIIWNNFAYSSYFHRKIFLD